MLSEWIQLRSNQHININIQQNAHTEKHMYRLVEGQMCNSPEPKAWDMEKVNGQLKDVVI